MKHINGITFLFCIIVMVLFCPQLTYARDKLPLKRGLYVRNGVSCSSASNADILSYDGGNSGFGDAHQMATIKKLVKHGNKYIIMEILKGAGGVGGEGTSNFKLTVMIRNKTSFVIYNNAEMRKLTGKKEDAYRWCSE